MFLALALVAVSSATVLFEERVVRLDALAEAGELWIAATDLERATGFELKPQGACRGEVCIPVRRTGADALVRRREGREWFSLTGFARKLGQRYVTDQESQTWSFGELPVLRSAFVSGLAPDFVLTDRKGRTVRLSDYRGRKVLLLTWASW